jgi:hypothetical protein
MKANRWYEITTHTSLTLSTDEDEYVSLKLVNYQYLIPNGKS